MAQDLNAALTTSADVLDLIAKKTLDAEERARVIRESVQYWTDHVNPGFLQYRKSVSTDYTAVEWDDEGAVFRDINGKEFIDCLGGFGIYVVGHRHPKVLKAVRDQLDRQAIHSQELIDPLRTYLAHLVSQITPGDLQYAFFTNSGTESIEGCLKMAMLTTGRKHFVGMVGGFHGKSLGSLGGTSKAVFREPFLPLLHWSHVPFGDLDALAQFMKTCDFSGDRVAGVVIEPIQGEGGINVSPPGFLPGARELCDRYGAMLILDEVQSGMGRTGKMFCCEHDGITPDLLALGKGFGGGVMPIGACVGTPKTWARYIENPFLHTTTFGGNPVCCAAAIATIHVLLEEGLLDQAAEKGDYLLGRMNELATQHPKVMLCGRGRGLMLGMEFMSDEIGYAVSKNLFARQILISGTYINSRVLRVEPPLVISREQMDTFLAALEDSMITVEREHNPMTPPPEPPAQALIPTRYRQPISRDLSHPIGAVQLSTALAGVPQFEALSGSFSGMPSLWQNTWLLHRLAHDPRPVLLAWFTNHCLGRTGSLREPLLAESYGERWGLTVYPLPSGLKATVRSALGAEGLAAIREWLAAPRTETWREGRRHEIEVLYDFDARVIGWRETP